MATFYLDSTGGSDAAAGTSWSVPWKTWANGPTAARIAPGDTIRIAKSPDPTLLANARWEDGPIPTAVNISSSTDAVPIQISAAGHGLSNNDSVYITGHTTNTNANGQWVVTVIDPTNFTLNDSSGKSAGAGAVGSVQKWNCKTVLLPAAVTKSISSCNTIWTTVDAAKMTVAVNAACRMGYNCAQLGVLAPLGVERAGFILTDNTDYSAYTQVSFQIKSTVALANGDFQLKLCSDLTGTVAVNTIAIPPVYANSTGWGLYTVDNSSALGSNIKSVALYQTVDKGALTMYLDNIIACKSPSSADSLTINSFISKDATACGGNEGWWGLMNITDRILTFDNNPQRNLSDNQLRGYVGDTTTTATYKRQPIIIPGTSAGSQHFTFTESGTSGALMTYSGGWNPVTNTQDGETYYDGINGFGQSMYLSANYIKIERVALQRYSYNILASGRFNDYSCTSTGYSCSVTISYGGNCSKFGCNVLMSGEIGITSGFNNVFKIGKIIGYRQFGVYNSAVQNCIFNIDKIWNNAVGLQYVSTQNGANYHNNIEFKRNASSAVFTVCGNQSMFNCKFLDTALSGPPVGYNSYIYSAKHDGTAERHRAISDGGVSYYDTTSGMTGGPGWTCAPSSARPYEYPFSQKMIKIAVPEGNKDVTASAWLAKDHATNVRTSLFVPCGQIGGLDTSCLEFFKSDTTAWEQVSAVFRPTEAGHVEVFWRSWYVAGAANVLCDSTLNVSMAP